LAEHLIKASELFQELNRSAASERVINYQNDDGSNNRYEHAVDVDAIDTLRTEHGKQIATHNRANNAENDIQYQAFTLLVYDFASDKPCDQPKHNPTDNRHFDLRASPPE
jgi:hypothetical protein